MVKHGLLLYIFGKFWSIGFLHKLKGYGAQDHFLDLIQSFYQPYAIKVVLNRQISRSFCINASIPQDSILEPSLFFFLKHLCDVIISRLVMYAHDATIYAS